jgi:hypothetical protein
MEILIEASSTHNNVAAIHNTLDCGIRNNAMAEKSAPIKKNGRLLPILMPGAVAQVSNYRLNQQTRYSAATKEFLSYQFQHQVSEISAIHWHSVKQNQTDPKELETHIQYLLKT